MDKQSDVKNEGTETARAGSWLTRNRSSLVVLGLIMSLLMIQWPMVKGTAYRLMGASWAVEDRIPWHSDFARALAEAGRTGKPVLMRFSAGWCPGCQVMRHEVWPDEGVQKAVIDGYIPVAVISDSSAGEELGMRYGVETIPAIIVVDAQGNVLKRGEFMEVDQLLKFLGH
jgi:thiol:disulfide interchange protein